MLMSTHEMRLEALRRQLKVKALDGFVVPISDPHMSEYVGDYAERLKWLTGFGGSAGIVVVLADKAAIFVDGRYTVQVRDQVDSRLFDPVAIADTSVAEWLDANAPEGAVLGHDAWLHSKPWASRVRKAMEKRGGTLIAVTENPVDAVWEDRPALPSAPLEIHELAYAGQSAADKRGRIAEWLNAQGLDATVMVALDSVAWTFNIRGRDIDHIPVALAYSIIRADGGATLFADQAKLSDAIRAHLGGDVDVRPYENFASALSEMGGKQVAVDPDRSPAAIFDLLQQAGAAIREIRDPAVLMKAVKNEAEVAGARAAHLRDGAALTRFLHWISTQGVKGGQDELSAAARLLEFRQATGCLRDLSFRTISATGPHGALPHYSVDEGSNIPIDPGQLYLVDSGGQYLDGTTDVTRVVAIGQPSGEMRRRYTQVLQGHIALSRAIFPKGTRGSQLDVLARQYLWADGVDFAHGTGHGVGSYLSVHEGPQRISGAAGDEALQTGMIVSNEPGYYKEGAFGIRIENLVLVQPREVPGAECEMLGFETLTFAPLDRALIDVALLALDDRTWVDAYHAEVLAKIGPLIDGAAKDWLTKACAPLE